MFLCDPTEGEALLWKLVFSSLPALSQGRAVGATPQKCLVTGHLGSREPSCDTMGKCNFSCSSQDSCQKHICKWFRGDGKWHCTGVCLFSWQPVIKSDAVHEGGLGDHSMLGWLCQHQSNPGYINKGGNSKELIFIVSVPWWVFSKRHLLGCSLSPSGAYIGDKKPHEKSPPVHLPKTPLTCSDQPEWQI